MKAICLALLSAVAAASALTGCYKVKNDAFCCTSQDTCAAHGATFPDDCEGNFKCDETTLTCVDPGNGGMCSATQPCTNPITPFCIDGTCKECMGATGCNAKAPVCGGDNICGTCTSETDCEPYKPGTPHCSGAGACVECNASKDCTTTTKPVCDTSAGTCGGCTSDSQCGSMTCDKTTGECIAEDRILYVSTTGSVGGSCTRTSPCNAFADAIALVSPQHDVIKALPGTYLAAIVLNGKRVAIYGEGATAQAPAGMTTISVTNGADVTIDGLHITGTSGLDSNGVNCSNATSTVRLRRTLIDRNTGGGVSITGCSYSIVNNFIVENGSVLGTVGSLFGGVLLTQINGGTTHEFSFNTVSANSSKSGQNTGVDCTTLGITLQLDDNIVFGNTVAGGGKQVAVTGCSWAYSDITDGVPGTENITTDPQFIDAGASNYHLMDNSPTIDHADPAATVTIDFDGNIRPAGKGRDIGADEAK